MTNPSMLKVGMLWRDTSDATLEMKVTRAALHWRTSVKHGNCEAWPDVCHVSPDALAEETTVTFGEVTILVAPLKTIMPDTFWIGRRSEQ